MNFDLRHLVQKLLFGHADAHTRHRLLYWTTQVVGNNIKQLRYDTIRYIDTIKTTRFGDAVGDGRGRLAGDTDGLTGVRR